MNVKYPCKGCVYFKVCGSNTRVEPCEGRQTKRQIKIIRNLAEEAVSRDIKSYTDIK